jgi:hypothetical protein
MAVRFEGTSAGVKGTTYTVQVHDSDFAGTKVDVSLFGDGFNLKYNPNEERPDAEIIDSAVDFAIMRTPTTKTEIDDFISDLLSAPDERFTLRILDSSDNLFWCGYILADQVRYEDDRWADTLANVRINAKDGLNRLKAIDYNDNGTAYTGRVTFKEHLFNILDKTGLQDFWGATDDYLLSIVRWYEDQDATAALTVNEMDRTFVDHLAFIDYDDNGSEVYTSTYDVLKNICAIWGARIYLADGAWHFEQWNEYRETGSIYQHRYYKDGTKPGTNTSVSLEVDESADSFTTASEGILSYLPSIRKVQIDFNHQDDRNYLKGRNWDDSTPTETIVLPAKGKKFRIAGTLRTRALFGAPTLPLPDLVELHEPVVSVVAIQIGFSDGGTNYSLGRTYTIIGGLSGYAPADWEGGQYPILNPLQSLPQFVSQEINFSTPAIPDDVSTIASFTFDVDYVISLRSDGSSFSVADYPVSEEFTFNNVTLQVMNADTTFPSQLNRSITQNPDNADASAVLEKEVLIGDGVAFLGSNGISIEVSGEQEPTGLWTKGLTGTGAVIQRLLAIELLNQRRFPIKIFDGTIYCNTAIHYGSILKLTTAEQFVGMQTVYNSKQETWRGQFTSIGYSDSASSYTTVDEPLTPGPGGAGGGSAPGEGPQTVPGTSADNPIGSSFPTGGHIVSTTGTSTYNDGDPVTSIGIETMNVDRLIQAGNTIAMIDRTTGNTQTFTVTTDVAVGDTSIAVSSTNISGQFSQSSFITLETDEYIGNIWRGSVRRYVQKFNSATPTLTVTENSGVLPADENNIDVHYGGQLLTPTDDYTVSGSNIVLTFTPKSSVTILVRFMIVG